MILKIKRLETLEKIRSGNKCIVVTNLMGYLRFLPLKSNYENSFINLKKGMTYGIDSLANKLYDIGYRREVITNTTGDMSIRGYVIDIFPIGSNNPIRIEFWGDEVDTISEFDIETQRRTDRIEGFTLTPSSEMLFDEPEKLADKISDI